MTTITRVQVQKIIDAADAVITALAGTNDDVHPDNHQKMCQLYDELNDRYATPEIVRELARIALQSLDAKPIAWTDNDELDDARKGYSAYLFALDGEANKFADPRRKIMLYTAPPALLVQPVIEDFKLRVWIRCEDQMPNECEAVIVSNGNRTIGDLYYWIMASKKKKCWVRTGKKTSRIDIDVFTHWMPLPTAPVQESE